MNLDSRVTRQEIQRPVNIDPSIYTGDPYMMVEWHHYAAGPYNYKSGLLFWSGNGSEEQRQTLRDDITIAKNFTRNTSLLSYFAKWMPKDNKGAVWISQKS